MWKKSIDSGSPPCSPQIPSLRSGLASRPVHAASRTSQPTPGLSIVSNGLRSTILRSMYRLRNLPSTSSRENPSAVCVRSFVPNEKKSATPAMRAHQRELLLVRDERNHDLELRRLSRRRLHRLGRPHDRAHLHLVDLRVEHAETHAARAEHRVGLLERVDAVERALELLEVRRALDARALDVL